MEKANEYINSIKVANSQIAEKLQKKIIENKNLISNEAISDIEHINLMLTTIIENSEKWPIDKSSRWLGFAQAKLAQHHVITLDEEREDTRQIFHNIYQESGITVPESIDLYNKK